jgi:hypothetical protein
VGACRSPLPQILPQKCDFEQVQQSSRDWRIKQVGTILGTLDRDMFERRRRVAAWTPTQRKVPVKARKVELGSAACFGVIVPATAPFPGLCLGL